MLPREYFVGKQVQGIVRKYTVQREIGEGGFSFVYRGSPETPLPDNAQVVAIKIFNQNADPQTLQGFVQEATRLARIKHTHIIPIYDFGMEEISYRPAGATQETSPRRVYISWQ